ncbi:MAG: hypothetical protein AAF721_05140 [Myxococcota bacterium]
MPRGQAPAPKVGQDVVTGELLAISTDQHGKIQRLTLKTANGNEPFAGCGAKLAEVPHVAAALARDSARVSLFLHAGCVSGYVVTR